MLLAADQLKSVKDLENATPNLTINTTGFTVQSVNIRGIGNAVVNPNIQPGVAVFQDGLLMAETVVLQQGFLDVGTHRSPARPAGHVRRPVLDRRRHSHQRGAARFQRHQRFLRRRARLEERRKVLRCHQPAAHRQDFDSVCVQQGESRQLLPQHRRSHRPHGLSGRSARPARWTTRTCAAASCGSRTRT